MFKNATIKATILRLLGVLAGGYLLVFGVVQYSSSATHKQMSRISTSLFPAALRLQEAEASYERMKKHYGDAVVLQDSRSLKDAAKDAAATAQALGDLKALLASVPSLARIAP